MTGQELIEWLERLPKEALGKPVQIFTPVDGSGLHPDYARTDVHAVDYDLRVVTLR